MRSEKPFIKDVTFFLNCTGLNPKNQTKFSALRTIVIVVLGTTILFLVFLEMVLEWNGIDSLMEASDVFVALFAVVVKLVFLIIYNDTIKKLLEDVSKFWSVEEMHEGVKKEVKSIYKFIFKFRIGINISAWSTWFSFNLKPILTKERVLPYKVHLPFDQLPYEIAYLLESINGFILVTAMLSVSLLFVTCITHAVCELKAIKHKFANLQVNPNINERDDKRCLQELDHLIERHSFVLGFIKDINNVYSLLMATQFLFSMFCICLGLFTLSGQSFPPQPSVAIKYGLFLVSYIGELFIFCMGGDIIVAESSSVANEIYKLDWWVKTQPKLRKRIVLVMLRAQKAEKITGGGMFTLNLECFTTVVRTAFSFFTFIKAMRGEAP